jgi:DNA-directed RNA polymerase specialized sigma24 family protein
MPEEHTITQESFGRLLNWLDPNDESAATKYEKIRQRLIRIFVCRGCYEAELLADQTIDRVTQKVAQVADGYVGEPAAYFYGVANKIHLEWLRGQKRARELAVAEVSVEDADDEREAEYSCLEKCLEELPGESKELIVEYYRDEKRAKIDRRKNLAKSLGVTIGALQIKASRIRSRLNACVVKCSSEK